MRFPKTEAEIRALVQRIIIGITENPLFPSPPVSSSDLRDLLNAFDAASDAQGTAQAAAEQATDIKQAALAALVIAAKAILRYAEFAVNGDDAKLSMLGWGGRSPYTPTAEPGQPLNLKVVQQGLGTVHLAWERPNEGGPPTYYVIKRLGRGEGETWEPVGSRIPHEIELTNQERGKEFEYWVVAINRAGESLPSNSVMVVL